MWREEWSEAAAGGERQHLLFLSKAKVKGHIYLGTTQRGTAARQHGDGLGGHLHNAGFWQLSFLFFFLVDSF